MSLSLDITGEKHAELNIPLPLHTTKRLKDQGVEAPEVVTLQLREANLRERKELARKEMRAKDEDSVEVYLVELLQMRAPDVDPRVLRALVEDMVPEAIRKVTHACIHGELPND